MNIGILPTANSIKQKRVGRRETCLFAHYKIDEQQKRLKKGHFPKRRENEDKGVVAIVKSVSQLVCVAQDSDALVSQGAKEFRESLERNSKSAIHQVHASSSEYPGQERTIVGKNKSRSSSAKSLRSKYRGSIPRRDWKTTAMCPKQARLEILPNMYTSSQKKQATFYSPAKKWVLPSASSKESCEKEFVVVSRASMHMVSEKDLHSAELATMRT